MSFSNTSRKYLIIFALLRIHFYHRVVGSDKPKFIFCGRIRFKLMRKKIIINKHSTYINTRKVHQFELASIIFHVGIP